jgi:hypothetical protein
MRWEELSIMSPQTVTPHIKATTALADGRLIYSGLPLVWRWTLTASSSHCSTNAPGADYTTFQSNPLPKRVSTLSPFFLRDRNTLKDIALLDRLLSCTRRTAKLSSKAIKYILHPRESEVKHFVTFRLGGTL